MTEKNTPTVRDFLGKEVYYDEQGQIIWGKGKDGYERVFDLGDIRGWGSIQHLFKEGDGIDMSAAANFQDQVGRFVVEAINEKLKRDE